MKAFFHYEKGNTLHTIALSFLDSLAHEWYRQYPHALVNHQ